MKTRSVYFLFSLCLGLVLAAGFLWAAARFNPAQAAVAACAPGPHNGVITADETWCLADSPHILGSSVTITNGVTVTIEPGVTVKGGSNIELKTLGHLSAIGTAEQPILFTSSTDTGPYQWAGLSFNGGTGDLQHVTVRYGGTPGNSVGQGNIAVANVTSGEVNIQDSQILSETYSYYLELVQCLWVINSHVTVDNTLFSGCADAGGQYDLNYPIYIRGASSLATLTNNTFVNNYKNRIALETGAMTGQDSTLWAQASVQSYELVSLDNSNYTVPAGITLTIKPGVTVMGNSGHELQVQGHLEAVGTPAQPILFTSVANSAPEQWSGVYFNGGTGNLSNVTIRYAGNVNSAGWHAGLVANNIQSGELILTDSTITDNQESYYLTTSHGMAVNNSHVQVSGSLFDHNGKPAGGYYGRDYALYIAGADSAVTLTDNTFTNNSRNKVGLAPGALSSATAITLNPQTTFFDGYEFDGSYTVLPTMTLTVEPGVTVAGRDVTDELLVQGHLEAVGTSSQPIVFTSGSNSAWAQWAGIVFDGGTGHLSYVTARYGGVKNSLNTYGSINAVNVPADGLLIDHSLITKSFYYGLEAINSFVYVGQTTFTGNGNDPRYDAAIYADQINPTLSLKDCIFKANARDVVLTGGGSAKIADSAFIGGWTQAYGGSNDAVIVGNGVSAKLLNNTFANLLGSGVYVVSGGSADLTNSIFAKDNYGIIVEAGGSASLDHTLWDRNGTNISGEASETGSLEGPAGFEFDGYHLTRYSMALERGVENGVTDDIDGEARPLPAGTAPDLGADEFPYTLGEDFAAEKIPFEPQWVILPDPVSGDPSGILRQSYYIRYFYGSPEANPPALTVNVTDTLPDELAYEAQETIPLMDFSMQGQTLLWQSQQGLEKDQSGEIVISGLYEQPVPGEVLTNHATLTAGEWSFDLQASTEVPLFPPLITSPGDGEICSGPDGWVNVTVKGAAQNSAIVKVYENGGYVGETTATEAGLFTYTYTSTQVGVTALTLSARTCMPSDPDQCSEPDEVSLTPQQSFWDPQLSYWEFFTSSGSSVIERFRRDGLFTTQDSVRPKTQGFTHSVVHLYVCMPVDELYVVADDIPYYPEPPAKRQIQAYGMGEAIINVSVAIYHPCSWLNASLNLEEWLDSTCALTDPDGYIFDVTEGFDPLSPTLHTVEGVTVTCMVSIPQWGGWVPWPAQLYDQQVNPQVTGEDGHFAFFTPPGEYYLQVEGGEAYESWRSPLIEVISEVVHMDVPLTPWSGGSLYHITLTANGPDMPEITIRAGSTVEWSSELSGILPPETILAFIENPVVRALSTLDPLANTSGWDSGMLAPGGTYRRQFAHAGVYYYTDGLGHTGKIIVIGSVYLPMVSK